MKATLLTDGITPKKNGRRFAIGDIHGNYETFNELLHKIKLSKNDALFLLGDYIDKGPDSKRVLNLIMHLQQKYNVQPILANHEFMFLLAYYDLDYYKIWKQKYGKETLISFGVKHIRDIPQKYFLWIKSLPLVVQSDNFILSHAGVNFSLPDPFEPEPVNRMNILFQFDAKPDKTRQFRSIIGHHSHTVAQCKRSATSNLIYCDAGCGKKNGSLVAYCLDDDSIVAVKQR